MVKCLRRRRGRITKNKRHEAGKALRCSVVWHLLKGHYSALEEGRQHLDKKLRTIAGVLGLTELRAMNFASYNDFIARQIRMIQNLSA